MARENKTAGLLPRPVWLLVRNYDGGDLPRAIGPFRTLDRLRGVAEGIVFWANDKEAAIRGIADAVPEGCDVARRLRRPLPGAGVAPPSSSNLINVLWFDYQEGKWDEEKEWNADRWQDVGLLLESFGIEFPGEEAPPPGDADLEEEEDREVPAFSAFLFFEPRAPAGPGRA